MGRRPHAKIAVAVGIQQGRLGLGCIYTGAGS
jgi:hypothetical protein